ncbi:MAG: hypothetical protein MZV63_53215 [Marinilabiliales bacterium]|nr:hypothetical protein [Marinilabiliales bacterium]
MEWSLTAAGVAVFGMLFMIVSKLAPIVSISELEEAGEKNAKNNQNINSIMNKVPLKQTLITLLIILGTVSKVSAFPVQETKISPYMLFTYLKDTDSRKSCRLK